MFDVSVVVEGDFACFTRSESKIDRVSYDVPTPSAARGMLEAIYCKPAEFWYEISEIKVLKPIRYLSMQKNEIKDKVVASKKDIKPIYTDRSRTQRYTVYLRDVAYAITAHVHVREDALPGLSMHQKEQKIAAEFTKRVNKGKCFWQPYLGLRECMAFFREPKVDDIPISQDKDLGIMLYDIFEPMNIIPLDTSKSGNNVVKPSYFYAKMENGCVHVPPYNSSLVLKS